MMLVALLAWQTPCSERCGFLPPDPIGGIISWRSCRLQVSLRKATQTGSVDHANPQMHGEGQVLKQILAWAFRAHACWDPLSSVVTSVRDFCS